MDNVAFAAVTRRLSLVSLGVAGLVTLASPITAGAKNTAKKLKKKQLQKCQSQVGPCQTIVTGFCEEDAEGDPDELQECLDFRLPFCEFLATCDTSAFLPGID